MQSLRHKPSVVDQLRIPRRHTLDGFAAFRLDHCSRDRIQAAALGVAEDVDRELLAVAHLLHHRLLGRVAEEELQLAAVGGAVDVPRAEAAPRLHEHREAEVGGQLVGQPRPRRRDAALGEEAVRAVLVLAEADRVGTRQEHERVELVATLGEKQVVEVGERHDEAHVVLLDERAQRVDVGRVVDTRHARAPLGRVQRRRELVDVGGERRRPGAGEGGDDVDALARAGEEDDRHRE